VTTPWPGADSKQRHIWSNADETSPTPHRSNRSNRSNAYNGPAN